jgi:anti-sigma-K factor RskA
VQPAAFSADATREAELWLIPADGKPRPLGMLRADRAVVITIPRELMAQAVANAVLAVSLEPPGGSTTGLPTGPVIAQGKLTTL